MLAARGGVGGARTVTRCAGGRRLSSLLAAPAVLLLLLALLLLPLQPQGFVHPLVSCQHHHHRRRLSMMSASESLLPAAPFVVYLTPGVPTDPAAVEAWHRKVGECAAAGVAVVQLRDKRLSPAELLPHAQRCRALMDAAAATTQEEPAALLVVNGHPDVARECGADGVHLPEAMLEEEAPQLLKRQEKQDPPSRRRRRRRLVGASVHSVEAALRAAELGVDYLQVGTMFPTGSHPEKGAAVEGPALMAQVDAALRSAGRRARLALVGVGGITPENCAQVVAAGADGVAVISGLAREGTDVGATVRALEEAMRRAVAGRDK